MKLVLHIGTEKTGTTTLQSSLRRSVGELEKQGVYFPLRTLGNQNHSNLVVIAGGVDDDGYFRRKAEASLQVPPARFADTVLTRLKSEMSIRNCRSAIFTSELLHSRLVDIQSKQKLFNFLSEIFDDITVVIYIRSQASLAISRLTTLIVNGSTSIPRGILPEVSYSYYFDYKTIIAEYESVFGGSNILVGLYDRCLLKDGDIRSDFEQRARIEPGTLGRAADSNTGLSLEALEFVAEWNRISQEGDPSETGLRRDQLRAWMPLLRAHDGDRPRPRPEDVDHFMAPYSAGNEWVRQRYFPERKTLFPIRDEGHAVCTTPRDESRAGRSAARAAATLFGSVPAESDGAAANLVAVDLGASQRR
ncbi:MAG: hypothetical protein KDK07_17800 [Bauldia sp.]|nr:hypothetical protein [Bauldia sp.]